MQYARWNPDRVTASKAATIDGFTQRRSDLLASILGSSFAKLAGSLQKRFYLQFTAVLLFSQAGLVVPFDQTGT